MYILSIESSAKTASCAVLKDDMLLCEYYTNNALTHSATLMPMIENMLQVCGLDMLCINLVAAAAGPGSFTGVRIGVATAKGLAIPFDTPCIGVSSLEALTYNLLFHEGIICPVMDARAGQVYCALFECEEGRVKRLCEDTADSSENLKALLEKQQKPVLLAGDGAYLLDGFAHARENLLYQRAFGVALCAKRLYNEGKSGDAHSLKPFYLRKPQAERERESRR